MLNTDFDTILELLQTRQQLSPRAPIFHIPLSHNAVILYKYVKQLFDF